MPDTPAQPGPPRLPAELTEASDLEDDAFVEDVHLGSSVLADRAFDLIEIAGCRFTGTGLSGSLWRRCSLRDCAFDGCDLANSTLERTGLRRVNVAGARLTGFTAGQAPHWDLSFTDCQAELSVWRQVRMERVRFQGCRLSRSDWGGSTLTDVAFEDCDLTGADFSQCRMKSVLFRGCRYEGIRGLDGFRGASVDAGDLLDLGVAMASALGIKVSVEDRA